jgi:tetratricopeptide (TPR) repeat protein
MTLEQQLGQAWAVLQNGDTGEAERICHGAIALHPKSSKAYQLLGLIYIQAEMQERAIAALQTAIDLDPANAEAINSLANLVRLAAPFAEAEALYLQALEISPQYGAAVQNLAALYLDADQAGAALALLRGFTGDQSGVELQSLKARALAQSGDPEAALQLYDQFPSQVTGNSDLKFYHAQALHQVGESEQALAELSEVERSNVYGHPVHHFKGQVLASLNRHDEALQAFEQALTIEPANAQSLRAAANVLFMQDKPADIHKLFELRIDDDKSNRGLRVSYAETLIRMGELDQAIQLIEKSAKQLGNGAEFHHCLSNALIEASYPAESQFHAEAALDIDPQALPVRANLVRAHLMQGEGEQALSHADRGLIEVPDDQLWIGLRISALRLLQSPEYERISDFAELVQAHELPVPDGYASNAEFNAALFDEMKKLHRFATHPLDQSLRMGSQTSVDLLHSRNPIIQTYYKMLDEPIRAYIDRMPDDPTHPLYRRKTGNYKFTGSWSVRLNDSGFHVSHVHPEGWISSAYYAEVPDTLANSPTKDGWIKFGEPPFAIPGADGAETWFAPKPGWLALFPSYMWHGTNPIHGKAHRMTIPFDAVPI